MKALSIRQPWVELILQGKKTVETRTWNTKFRGRFLIRSGKRVDADKIRELGWKKSLETGKVLGSAVLKKVICYDSKEKFMQDYNKHLSRNFKNPTYGFVLEDVKRVKPCPLRGQLGFYEV